MTIHKQQRFPNKTLKDKALSASKKECGSRVISDDILNLLPQQTKDAQRWMTIAAPDFFLWLQENIDDDNILDLIELKEYEELRQSGNLLSEQELNKKLKEIDENYPRLSEYKELDLNIAQTKLSEFERISMKQKKNLDALDLTNQAQDAKISKFNLKIYECQKESEFLVAQAIKTAEKLQHTEDENQKLCDNLQDSVNAPGVFTHQMQFYEHNNNMDDMIKQLENYCAQNQIFTELTLVDQNYETNVDELQKAKDELVNAKFHEILLKMKITSMEYVNNEIRYNTIKLPRNMNELIEMMNEYESINEQKDSRTSNLKKSLLERLSDIILSQIEIFSTKNVKYKHNRATNRIQNIKEIHPIVTKMIQISEIIWFAFNFDYERLNIKFFCDDFMSNYATNIRVEKMKRILEEESIPKYLSSTHENTKHLLESFTVGGKVQIRETFEAYSTIKENLKTLLTNVTKGIAGTEVNKYLNELSVIEKIMKTFVYGGVTSKPILHNPKNLKNILKLTANNEEIGEQYDEIKKSLKEYDSIFVQDKFFRYTNVLWIWFLTEPNKVLQAIQEVKKASDKAPAHLSGLRRQN
uniref:CSON005466 protein n=1 Tax=Culicoides sonorensis TaxID=179676 RepID=A0A336M705_CULSO